MKLDIRTYLILVVLLSTCATINTDIYIEIGIMVTLSVLQLISSKGSFMLKLVFCYIVMLLIQFMLFPVIPDMVSALLSLPVVNIRSFFPTIMCIVLLYKNTQVSQMTATFSKMHLPKGLTITLAVAVRYIPALKEEWLHIRDAMRMRNVTRGIYNPIKKLSLSMECYLAPLFVSALKTADELSAAAVTRGIDNPLQPTCRNYRTMQVKDYLIIALTVALTAFCLWQNYGG